MNDDEQRYGSYEPAAEDIAAIAEYVRYLAPHLSEREHRKLMDRAAGVWERYVEGFAQPAED